MDFLMPSLRFFGCLTAFFSDLLESHGLMEQVGKKPLDSRGISDNEYTVTTGMFFKGVPFIKECTVKLV